MARERSADICHEVLMHVLPGVADGDFASFAAGINRMQELLGGHFAGAQSGSAWTSPAVGRLLQDMRAASDVDIAIGQSSWGPTGFAFVPSAAAARRLIDAAHAAGAVPGHLRLHCVTGRNRGAVITERAARRS
jgi:predicted sugar kinase